MLLALAVDPVMKNPAEPSWSSPAESAAEVAIPDLFGEAPVHQRATDGYRPDFDYDEVVGAEWALPEGEAAREAIVAQPPPEGETEADSSARKSRLVQGGLY